MVEGKTLLVFLLLGRCQHSATVPQPAKKGAVALDPQSTHAATVAQQSRVGLCAALSADAQATGRERVLNKSRHTWELYF